MPGKRSPDLPVVGWREWLALPDLGVEHLKAKIDTGARTSSLHVFDLEEYRFEGLDWVRFSIHPFQRSTSGTVCATSPVLEYRKVRSSSGQATLRPVIRTRVSLLGCRWEIEATLANRDAMGFRMLLGRQAVRDRFLIDPGRSFYAGRPRRKPFRKRKKPPNPGARRS
jgi:hypothetical protein